MATKILYATKDTTLMSSSFSAPSNFPGGGFSGSQYANAGASQILALKKTIDTTTSASTGKRLSGSGYPININRILVDFNVQKISSSIASGDIGEDATFNLKMYNATAKTQVAKSFDVDIHMLTSASWDEGLGLDLDTYKDIGYASWIHNTSTASWNTGGLGTGSGDTGVEGGGDDADYTPNYFARSGSTLFSTQHFPNGDEDLDVAVTSQVGMWLTGAGAGDGMSNLGFLLKLSVENEDNGVEYPAKYFFSKDSHTNRKPRLVVKWDDFLGDDRGHFRTEEENRLYLYHKSKGQLADIREINTSDTQLTCSVYSGSISGSYPSGSHPFQSNWALPTGPVEGEEIIVERYKEGIYRTKPFEMSRSFLSGSGSGVFYDVWTNSSLNFITTRSFELLDSMDSNYFDSVTADRLQTSIINVNPFGYNNAQDEDVRFDINIRTRGENIDDKNRIRPFIIHTGSYEIREKGTQEIVIPFSDSFTRLSYNENGNFFDMDMRSFDRGRTYEIFLKYKLNGQVFIAPETFEFKVV